MLTVLAGLLLQFDQVPLATAQGLVELQTSKIPSKSGKGNFLPLERRLKATQNAYILGPGDSVLVELLDVPEYSGIFTIGPDGMLTVKSPMKVKALDNIPPFGSMRALSTNIADIHTKADGATIKKRRVGRGGSMNAPPGYFMSGSENRHVVLEPPA